MISHAAFGWHMRAGAWAATRDIVAAWASWERARQVADALPADDAGRTAMRIAARAWLCGNAFRVHVDISGGLFEELRELCTAAGDKPSLAIGMAGLALEHNAPRPGAGGVAAGLRNHGAGRVDRQADLDDRAVPRSDQYQVSDRRDGRGAALVADRHRPGRRRPHQREHSFSVRRWRSRWHRAAPPGGRWAVRGGATTYDRALAMARGADPMSHAVVIMYAYGFAIAGGVLLADDAALRDIEEALEITERSSEDFALGWARWALGVALVHRDSPAERERGLAVLGQVRDMCLHGRFYQYLLAARGRVHRAGAGQARRPRRCYTANAWSHRRFVPSRTARVLHLRRPPFWWRRCWSVVPGMTWPKPRPRSTGWRPRQTTMGW